MPIASISGLHSSSSSGSVGPALSFHGSSTSPASYSSNGDSTSSHESDSSTYASSENPPWRKLSEYGNFDESEPHIGFINLERFLLVLDAMGNLGVEGYTNYDWVSYAFFRAAQFWDERLLYRNGEVILMRFLGAIPSNCKGITTLERVENAFVETSLECGDQYPVWEGAYYYEEQSSQSDEQ
ncbi:uncharacterized protein BDZ99DRAFT_494012 [Mytilinidion resinicola]|uniref:Uncharacterized protein n=1 Tax=Mytilinidion resinicola TaxID=574789 RepID=A0A6A6Z5M1_9PEZI|nr:uncharacterized protein BDZ99DRAFT_494012 [Mytilinidion resinicola]KAF2816128.1 hypothetical protein BDZ99DRAFT_494012 [Mytilinidion resinicola]